MTKVIELADVRKQMLATRRAKMIAKLVWLAQTLGRTPTLVEFANTWTLTSVPPNKAAALIASWWGLHSGRGRYALASRALYRQAHLKKRTVGRQTKKSMKAA